MGVIIDDLKIMTHIMSNLHEEYKNIIEKSMLDVSDSDTRISKYKW